MVTLFAAGLILGSMFGCGGSHPGVVLDDQTTDRALAVPAEIEGKALELSGPTIRLEPNDIILQKAPALLHAPDTLRRPDATSYCAMLPPEPSHGRLDVREADASDAFSLSEDSGRLLLQEGARPVLAYNFGTQLPEGIPQAHARSSYIHPVWGIDGTVLTDDFPEDHLHHRGLSWMWPRVFVERQEYDLWALRGMEQVFDEWLLRETGPVCATIGVKNHWELTEDGRNVLDEWVWVRAFKADRYGRALDIRITLEAREPIEIAGRETDSKGYGGFSLRFAPREETVIMSSAGHEAEDSDHSRLPWADESGRFGSDGSMSGIAIFQHETHPEYPAKWTLRHYGFLGVAWPSVERRALHPGEPITLRYRVWIHSGDAKEGMVAEAYDAFANPAAIRLAD